jgi:hypothetical protein
LTQGPDPTGGALSIEVAGSSPAMTGVAQGQRMRLGKDGDGAMLATDTDILAQAEAWRRAGRGVALATVVETWGSAPRPVGSHLVADQEGNFLGSVSGGCVEGAVITEAVDVIAEGAPKMLEFGVATRRLAGGPLLRRADQSLCGTGRLSSAGAKPS